MDRLLSTVSSLFVYTVMALLTGAGCGDDAKPTGDSGATGAGFCQSPDALDLSPCDTESGTFSLTIDNPYYPLVVGEISIFEGEEDGEQVHLEIEVLNETKTVAGVVTRVVEEREQQDGELVEVSRNYFAQATDGSVCYFGEDVDIYERGNVVSHESAWLAGVGKNRPGIVMPATPRPRDFYAQEEAEGVAQDRAEITLVGKKVSVPAGTFSDTLETKECSPLEPGVFETKYYARGVGQITDGPIELVSPRYPR